MHRLAFKALLLILTMTSEVFAAGPPDVETLLQNFHADPAKALQMSPPKWDADWTVLHTFESPDGQKENEERLAERRAMRMEICRKAKNGCRLGSREHDRSYAGFSDFDRVDRLLAGMEYVEQLDCKSVRFENGERGEARFQMSSAGPTEISIRRGSSEQTLRFMGPRMLMITREYEVLDVCTDREKYVVQRSEIVRWDDESGLENHAEILDADYIRNVSRALKEIPQKIQDLLAGSEPQESFSLDRVQLMDLLGAEISVEAKRCRAPDEVGDASAE